MEHVIQMMLSQIREYFPPEYRPEYFTDRNHCSECKEHDDALRSHTPDSIGFDELGNPGWNPICFINTHGYFYYMPALCRLAWEGEGDNYYIDSLLSGMDCNRIEPMNPMQSRLIHDYLCFLRLARIEDIRVNDDEVLMDKRIMALFNQSRRKG